MELSLNTLYSDFSVGLLDKREFEGEIFRVIRKNIHQFGLPGLNRDDHDDYISWLYPRIKSAVQNYQETGASFEAYINSLVRLTVREYRLRQTRSYAAESAAWLTRITDLYAGENEPQYDCSTAIIDEELKRPRQHLILVLKCCSYVSDDFLERASSRLGIEPEALKEMVGRLKTLRMNRLAKIDQLREKAHTQLFRCLFYECCLQTMPDTTVASAQLRLRLDQGRTRLTRIRSKLARLRLDPSNNQIAEILGIAKGTVDTALHCLKQRNGNLTL